MISNLLYILIRLALLAVITFLFVVLYEHGPSDYLANVRRDALSLAAAAEPKAP